MKTRRLGPLIRALAGTVLALGLLVGVPLALVRLVGNPLPTVIPSWDEMRFALGRGQIDAWTWVKAFALVAWAAWADLALSFLIEVVAVVRGGRRRRWAALTPTRWLAARVVGQWTLVASLMMQAGGPVPLAVLPSMAASAVAVLAPDLDDPSPARVAAGVAPSPGPTVEVEVGRRDTLWGLAQQHLGAGGRWETIRDANVGRAMPDGTVLAPGFTRLEPGWTLRVPGTPDAAGPNRPAEAPLAPAAGYLPAGEVVVERGDNLWELAEERLAVLAPDPTLAAVASYVDDVVAGNQAQIRDPDLIFPGQRFDLPALGDIPLAAPPLAPGPPTPADGPDRQMPRPTGGPVEAPTAADPADDRFDNRADGVVAPTTPEVSPGADGAAPVADGGEPVTAEPLVLGAGGALLAAGALGLVRRRRRYRMAHRRPSTVPAGPGPSLDPIERALNRQADLAAARWLDAALASLAARPVWEGEAVAQPTVIEFGPDRLRVGFTHPDPVAAPLPWSTDDQGLTWWLDRGVAAADLPSVGVDHPVPALVTVGEGTMVNLEAIGVLALSGIDDGPRDLLRSIVHELATSSAAGTIDIRSTLAIEGTDSYRLVRRAEPAALVAELVPWLDEVADRLVRSPATSSYAHRLAADGEAFSPVVIVADWAARDELAPLLRRAETRALPLAVVLADPVAADEYRVELDGQRGRLLPWGLALRPQRLEAEAAADLGGLLLDAAEAGEEPLLLGLRLSASVTDLRQRLGHLSADPAPAPVPPVDPGGPDDAEAAPESQPVVAELVTPEPELVTPEPVSDELVITVDGGPMTPPAMEVAPITVHVLGPVEVAGVDGDLTSQQLSLLCYLACNGASSRATLIDALWDGQVISQSRFPNLLAELRARIGRHHFPEARDGRYQLVAVTTDLDEFERGVQLANRQDPTAAAATLHRIMSLVRGVPLEVSSPRFWSWVGDQTHFSARVEAMVADAAARLARLELDRGRLDAAQWACEQGLTASPTDETLVVTLTEVYMAAGKPGQARRVVEAWEDKISRLDCGEPSAEPRKRLVG